jgi:serine/threonine-protein kinase
LAYLHGRGLVHGDISPGNIRCDHEGRPVLIDFGLSARVLPVPETHDGLGTVAGGASGTLGFIAPEALVGERGPATDLFSLGATLYAAWTEVPPFGVGMEAVRRLMEGPPPAPSSLRPGLPAEWDALLGRLMALAAEHRPASARELLREIRRILPGHTPLAIRWRGFWSAVKRRSKHCGRWWNDSQRGMPHLSRSQSPVHRGPAAAR